jgi:hypothetical protein
LQIGTGLRQQLREQRRDLFGLRDAERSQCFLVRIFGHRKRLDYKRATTLGQRHPGSALKPRNGNEKGTKQRFLAWLAAPGKLGMTSRSL